MFGPRVPGFYGLGESRVPKDVDDTEGASSSCSVNLGIHFRCSLLFDQNFPHQLYL